MSDGGSEFRPRLVYPRAGWRLPVGTCGAQQQVASLEGPLSKASELQHPACTCALRTEGPRGGNPISGGGHR